MSSFEGQSTDAENSKAASTASKPGDDLKTSSLGSSQAIAQESNDNQNSKTGSGAGTG